VVASVRIRVRSHNEAACANRIFLSFPDLNSLFTDSHLSAFCTQPRVTFSRCSPNQWHAIQCMRSDHESFNAMASTCCQVTYRDGHCRHAASRGQKLYLLSNPQRLSQSDSMVIPSSGSFPLSLTFPVGLFELNIQY